MSGSSGGSSGGKKKARIEIIPLIDVIFFLLATFVLFTLSLNKSGGLNVSLPDATTSGPRDPAGAATISITKEGTIGWDKENISLDQFITRIQAFKRQDPDARVLINGDENALFTQARYVIDEVRKAGFTRILIETQIKQAD